MLSILARFPGEIKRIDRNTVSPEARAGIERHVAKWFGFSGVDHFPNIDIHGRINSLQLVHERDIDAAKNIFQKLGGFGRAARGDRNQRLNRAPIQLPGCLQARGRVAPNYLRNCRDTAGRIARIIRGYQGETTPITRALAEQGLSVPASVDSVRPVPVERE